MKQGMDFSKINEILEEILIENKEYVSEKKYLDVYVFPQRWGSTALGFAGIGCSAMTTAYTVVVCVAKIKGYVYFGSRHAYTINNPKENFFEDIKAHKMASVRNSQDYK